MQKIAVGLGEHSYDIFFGVHVLAELPQLLTAVRFPHHRVIISNPTVMSLHGELLLRILEQDGARPVVITVPDGEKYKNLATLTGIYDDLLTAGIDRSSGIIAFGGGVIGDMAGFAAATFMRGLPCVQIPTTLLSQVDSSVGGKTAVNHAQGKNIIGAFYQPRLVCIDSDMLHTLPDREYNAGIAEIVKYGVIRDSSFFEWLEKNAALLIHRDTNALLYAIKTSCQTKADIVEIDEKEGSLRAILNFGHTFGHAVETLTGYKQYLHGEAVAIGMVVAAQMSRLTGLCRDNDVTRISALLRRFNLPVAPPDFSRADYLEVMMHDKKVNCGMLRMILNRNIGDCVIQNVAQPDELLSHILGE